MALHPPWKAFTTQPAGLVLLDTYRVDRDNRGTEWLLALPAALAPRLTGGPSTGDDDSAVAAMGAYTRMFMDWEPEPVATPTLLVRATEPTPRMAPTVVWVEAWMAAIWLVIYSVAREVCWARFFTSA